MANHAPGPFFTVPAGTRVAECRGCGERIFWIETPGGKRMPVDCDVEGGHEPSEPQSTTQHDGSGVSHFATCPDHAKFRRPR